MIHIFSILKVHIILILMYIFFILKYKYQKVYTNLSIMLTILMYMHEQCIKIF